ncbi:MAG: sigma-70 family RNA polymerase sigma factor [candidate division Zixibacteria bacterium]|nr:sigma-70 family RNA polymerase sigma factor [candidate division Zixibacteria bacterium]
MSACPPESKALIDRILGGDRKAFKTLVEDHQRLVSHVVFRMIANRQDREDVCQDVFMKVYRNLGRFRHESRLSTWIARIAHNACLTHLEAKRIPVADEDILDYERPDTTGPEGIAPDRLFESRDLAERIQTEIDSLPLNFRTALTLFHLDNMNYAEIADIMKMPENTIKSHLFRGRRMLKERLSARYGVEDLWR